MVSTIQENQAQRKSRGGLGPALTYKNINYYAIYGTIMGQLVEAKSKLVTELHQALIHASANFLSEVTVPKDLDHLRGHDGKITKTTSTDQFTF